MVVFELADAGVQSLEGLAMRGQHQRVLGQRQIALQRIEEPAQRVSLGLVGMHADIGGNARQHHVAADEYIELGAIESHVFWRMAVADDAFPA
ncbi:hypothetical protein D3C85_1370200 [compost metagenome]